MTYTTYLVYRIRGGGERRGERRGDRGGGERGGERRGERGNERRGERGSERGGDRGDRGRGGDRGPGERERDPDSRRLSSSRRRARISFSRIIRLNASSGSSDTLRTNKRVRTDRATVMNHHTDDNEDDRFRQWRMLLTTVFKLDIYEHYASAMTHRKQEVHAKTPFFYALLT